MKTLKIVLLLVLFPPMLGLASGGHVELEKANIDISDMGALQRGVKSFSNFCMGCHGVQYSSYKRVAKDLRLPEPMVLDNLVMSWDQDKKIGSYMTTAMTKNQGKLFFGKPAPDLSVIARARGTDWLYTYLKSFYLDPSKPFGMNNLVFDSVSMPHVLVELQGEQKAVYKEVDKILEKEIPGKNGGAPTIVKETVKVQVLERLEIAKEGRLKPDEYNALVKDLVTFLAYVGEPTKLERQRIGSWVMLFLLVFTVLAYYVKKEYWRDVH